MQRILLGIGLLTLVTACQRSSISEQQIFEQQEMEAKVIYGDDDRREYFEVSENLQRLTRSTVALVKTNRLSTSANLIQLQTSNYGSGQGLCASEPFREQPTGAFCSGTLVGKNLVLTAGHCIETQSSCDGTSFVFDFRLDGAGSARTQFQPNQVYRCKRIVVQELRNNGTDYALVELDRDVEGAREPVQVDRTALTQVGRSILVIGHPSGLPTKVAGGGQVRSVLPSHVVTNLDTYGGNSGSGVFDLVNLKLVGILVRGENDFVSAGSCTVSNRCAATGCRGEDVTRLEPVLAHIPDLGGGNDEEDDGEAPPPGPGETVTASANLPIPDADPNGVISSLAVQGEHVGKNLKVAVNISHTWVGDLKLELVAPDGKVVLLQFQKGGRQRDLVGVYGSTLVSQTPLNSLAALSKRGFWKLRVTDTLMRDVGRLNSWGVQIQ